MNTTYRGCAFRNAMKGGDHGKARRQDRSGDGRRIGDRRGDSQAFRRRGRERGILRSGRRARPSFPWRPNLETAGAKVAFTQADRWVPRPHASPSSTVPKGKKFGRLDILINNARHPQIREGVDEAERGELERDPQRQPDELRLLCQGGGSADARYLTRAAPSLTSPSGMVRRRRRRQPAKHDTTKAAIAES